MKIGLLSRFGALVRISIGWGMLAAAFLRTPTELHADTALPPSLPVKIAVIGGDSASDLAPFLTATLSQQSGLVLVERDELAKIGDERALREMAARDGPALGNLLHADGLLFLSKNEQETEVRFTAARLGLVLFDVAIDPKADLKQVAETLGGRIIGVAPKLGLPPGEAIPISLLGLHADLGVPRAESIERTLALLLEKNLIASPHLVVLERRHAGSLALERDLLADPAARPASGMWWIDGALALSSAPGGDITGTLRLRSPGGGVPVSLEVRGSESDLPKLAAAMALSVVKATGGGAPGPSAEGVVEARQYLMEGLWAQRHGKNAEAVAAFDSAAWLGEAAPDLLAGRIAALIRNAWVAKDPDVQADALIRACDDMGRYIREAGEGHLQILDAYHTGEGKTSFLKDHLFLDGSQRLHALQGGGSPRAADLRQALRACAGFDPLHGQVPGNDRIVKGADDWCESLDEEKAYYRAIFVKIPRGEGVFQLNYLPYPMIFSRFLPDPQEKKRALVDLLGSLVSDPGSRLTGLFFRALHNPDSRTTDYAAFLDGLWNERESLRQEGRLNAYLAVAFLHKDVFPPPADPRLIATLRYYLQHETKWGDIPQMVWHPEFFTQADAPALWDDLQGAKERCLPNSGGGSGSYISKLESDYLHLFPAPPPPPSAVPDLVIHRSWYPASGDESHLLWCAFDVVPDGLWLAGGAGGSLHRVEVVGGELTGSSTPLPAEGAAHLLATPQAVYLVSMQTKSGEAATTRLHRYDTASATWEERDGSGISQLYDVGGTLYFSLHSFSMPGGGQEGAVGRYDWKTGQKTILASNRRNPPQNQFDSDPDFATVRIFAGPGGVPWLFTHREIYRIDEKSGPWTQMFTANDWYQSKTEAGVTLLFGPNDQAERFAAVAVIAPDRDAPEEQLSVPKRIPPHFHLPGTPNEPPATLPEWAEKPRWNGNYHAINFALRGDDLIGYQTDRIGGRHYHLLYFQKGRPEPIVIPLTFMADAGAQAALPALCGSLGKQVLDPEGQDVPPAFASCREGIFFVPSGGLVWFLPYTDIDGYLAAAKK